MRQNLVSPAGAGRLLLLALLLPGGAAGCSDPSLRGVAGGAPSPRQLPDLTRPLRINEWRMATQGEEPLVMVQRLAHTAGGTWVGLAPRPLELVTWQPQRGSAKTQTAGDVLKALEEKKTSLEREARAGYLLIFFGKKDELEASERGTVEDVTGLYVAAPSGRELVAALSDVLRLDIRASPAVYRTRETLVQVRRDRELTARDEQSPNNYGRVDQDEEEVDLPVLLELKSGDRVSVADLMQKLGSYFGAECRQSESGEWELLPLTEPHRLSQEIGRLQEVIKEAGGEGDEGFTSFAGRSGAGTEDEEEIEPDAAIPHLADEALEAFDNLALLGPQAVTTLTTYLDPERASRTRAAIAALSAMPQPEAGKALLDFGPRLMGKMSDKARPYRKRLLLSLVKATARDLKPEAVAWLLALLRDGSVPAAVRQEARMALLGAGKLDAIARDAGRRDLPALKIEFSVREPKPKGAPSGPTEAIPAAVASVSPISIAKLPNGDRWAVFTSGLWGNRQDLWLAHSERGKWTGFHFTGAQFERGGRYAGYSDGSDGSPPPRGSCMLEVEDGRIIIRPPDQKRAKEFEQLAKRMQDRELMEKQPGDYVKLSQRYSELAGSVQNALGKTFTFTLEELRKDTDGDGLTDLLEARLGTDPKKSDTDDDGLSDGRDANPLLKPGASGDRSQLLQAVFFAMVAGDPASGPTVVLLDGPMQQEFVGANGPVVCLTSGEQKQRLQEIGGLRTLEFGGPKDSSATILRRDGPCLFNDASTRVQIQFWTWPAAVEDPANLARHYYGRDAKPVDYVATFFKTGSAWKLEAIKRWKWNHADAAGARRQQLEQAINARRVF